MQRSSDSSGVPSFMGMKEERNAIYIDSGDLWASRFIAIVTTIKSSVTSNPRHDSHQLLIIF
jgi:hypothetical protein